MKHVIVNIDKLDELVPLELIEYKGYTSEMKLKDIHFSDAIELEDGTFLLSVYLLDIKYKDSRSMQRITEQDELFANIYWKDYEIIEDTSYLKFKEEA